MSEDISRRKALSPLTLGGALDFTLSAASAAVEPSEVEAEATGTAGMKGHHTRRTSRNQPCAVQPATAPEAPAGTVPADVPNEALNCRPNADANRDPELVCSQLHH